MSTDLVDAEAWLRAFATGFYVTPGAKKSARAVLTEYDRMKAELSDLRSRLEASDAWEVDHRAILEAVHAVAATYRPRESDDERVIDWDLLKALIVEVRR
jgi:hypothetical protein